MPGVHDDRVFTWSNRWFRVSVISLVLLTAFCVLVGFVVLPSVHGDYTAQGVWASICRAAGLPSNWVPDLKGDAAPRSTTVVLIPAMAKEGASDAIGRGATLALNCTMCHGAQGTSSSDAPNLAGQYPEVIIKQLLDYKSGRRTHSLMEQLSQPLSDQEMNELAVYFASLPKARTAPTTYDESLPALVRVGDPMRNIAPCISCHGGVDQKLGAPWLEGMPKAYLVGQIEAFRKGTRANDPQAQMRNMVRTINDTEVDEVATFYARKIRR